MRTGRFLIGGAVGVVALTAMVWALLPDPVQVDLVVAKVAPLEVTVAAEGITRVRDPWLVTAPITGITTRSPVEVGDAVMAGQTVVAAIQPAAPALLDARARLQAEAAVTEAEAAVRLAEVNVARAQTDLTHAQTHLSRTRELAARGTITQQMLEDSEQSASTMAAALDSARYELDLRRAALARAQAQLVGPENQGDAAGLAGCCVDLTAPHDGTVLEVVDVSARLVLAGSPLLTIGDLSDLQIEVDLLSSDAVRVRPGAMAHVERWGGDGVIDARVARIDPAGFTRISALGIEEQRVRVHLDIETPPDARPGLGDRYRVFVRIVVWSDDAVLQVPQSALFRHEGGWAVYTETAGRAVLVPVTVGQGQDDVVQILAGLSEGARVVAYPGSRVTEGVRIAQRRLE